MTAEQMVQYAYEEGFSAAAVVDTSDIVFDPSFRPYCEENLCGQYGANHSCPPDCGTPEEMKQKVLALQKGEDEALEDDYKRLANGKEILYQARK